MTTTAHDPSVKMTMVITLRNGVQIRAGVKDSSIRRNTVTEALKGVEWTADDDPFGNSIGYIEVAEIVAVHFEREPRC